MWDQKQRSIESQVVIWAGASVLLMILEVLGWLAPVRSLIERGLGPFERVALEVKRVADKPEEILVFYRNGSQRLVDMEARLAERVVEYAELESLRQENQSLREQLGAGLGDSMVQLPARVVGENGQRLLILLGSNQGVEGGEAVVVEDVLVGVVEKVSRRSSEVARVGSKETTLAGRVLGRNVDGVLKEVAGQVVLDQVVQTASIDQGDVVVTSGADGLPAGLVVARVAEVGGSANELYKKVVVVPLVEEREIENVFVLMDKVGGSKEGE